MNNSNWRYREIGPDTRARRAPSSCLEDFALREGQRRERGAPL
jgi:hypothetical protein